jgi:hypothetical protein
LLAGAEIPREQHSRRQAEKYPCTTHDHE